MAPTTSEQMQQPLTARELEFIKLLLRQGDACAQWRSWDAIEPTGNQITSAKSRAALSAAIKQGWLVDPRTLHLLATKLKRADRVIAARICGDLDPEALRFFTPEEKQALALAYETWNGTPEEYDADHFPSQGWQWAGYYAAKCTWLARHPEARPLPLPEPAA